MPPEIVDDEVVEPSQDMIVQRLADAGLSPEIISYATNTPLTQIRAIVVKRRPEAVPLIDETLADGVRKLAAAALREAHNILEFGPTPQKLAVIRSMLGGLSRHVAAGSSVEEHEARTEFEAFLFEMRTDGIPERETVVTDETILDVSSAEPTTTTQPADDQD